MNQHEQIITHFKKYKKPLTAMAAWENYGISKLATRISELLDHGYPIRKRWIIIQNRDGRDTKVMQYTLGK